MQLTAEQSRIIREHPERPCEVTDPVTDRKYVLVAVEVFDQLQEELADFRQARGWERAVLKGMALAVGDDQ